MTCGNSRGGTHRQAIDGTGSAELGPSLSRDGALTDQQDLDEVLAWRGGASSSEPGTAPGAPATTEAASVSSPTVEFDPFPMT